MRVSYSEYQQAKRTLQRKPKTFVKQLMIKTIEDYERTKQSNRNNKSI